MGRDEKAVSNFIRDFLQDVERDVQEPYFTVTEVRILKYEKRKLVILEMNF